MRVKVNVFDAENHHIHRITSIGFHAFEVDFGDELVEASPYVKSEIPEVIFHYLDGGHARVSFPIYYGWHPNVLPQSPNNTFTVLLYKPSKRPTIIYGIEYEDVQ